MGYEKMKNYLEIKNISKSYSKDGNKKEVLKNIDLIINKNEFITILGPSGCGKSTLLKIIASFTEVDSGGVYKNDKRINEPDLDRIMVFQEFSQLFPWKTVIKNVVFALKAADRENNFDYQAAAADYLQQVGLGSYINYYPHQLSGGMKQRAALARAFAARAEIMLMDEPFGSLDSLTRRSLQSLLTAVWRNEKPTVIFVTHDIREAIYLSDKIVIMLNEPGEVKEIINNNLPRPRDRTADDFSALYKKISDLMS